MANSRAASDALAIARHVLRLPPKLRTNRPVRILPEVHPSTWKKVVLNNGRSKKPDVLACVRKRWPVETDSEDVADSLCIGQYGLQFLAAEAKMKKREGVLHR
jgi:Holliday junction resolvasome RuvABC endonuclease subunit